MLEAIKKSDLEKIICSEKEKMVVEHRHGLVDGITHTLEETGRIFGVTRERIRQIEAKVYEKIRQSKKHGTKKNV